MRLGEFRRRRPGLRHERVHPDHGRGVDLGRLALLRRRPHLHAAPGREGRDRNYRIFESTDDWGEETESHEFAVRRFGAKLTGSGSPVLCFGFVHFTGHVAGSTGYRHIISGYSCTFGSTPPTDARIDQLVGNIAYDFE